MKKSQKMKNAKRDVRKAKAETDKWRDEAGRKTKLLDAMQHELAEASRAMIQTNMLVDAVLATVVLQCGERVEEEGELVGYRLDLPDIDVSEVLAEWDVTTRIRAGDNGTHVEGYRVIVTPHDDPPPTDGTDKDAGTKQAPEAAGE